MKQATKTAVVLVSEVRPNSDQPRKYFKESALRSLARSIQRHGQRTPIEVKALQEEGPHKYEIIEGERRWRACKLAGIQTIRATIDESTLSRVEQHMLSLVANLHREGHTHMEISRAMKYQVDNGTTIPAIAESVDRSDAWVYQYLSLQKLTSELQEKMHPELPTNELLRFGEALVVASLPAELQDRAYRLMLTLPVKLRLTRVRKFAEEMTGIKRRGRGNDTKRHMERFVDRLSGDTERVLEMKSSDFAQVLAHMPSEDVRTLIRKLATAKNRITELVQVLEREAEKIRAAKTQRLRLVGGSR